MSIPLPVEENDSLNMTPMIDVVFNLLIFFLLGSTYMSDERELALELPTSAVAAPLTEAPDEIIVNVLADGKITVQGAAVSMAELERRLEAARKNYADQAVAVRGDASVRYQAVADVISACRRTGIAHLDVLVREP